MPNHATIILAGHLGRDAEVKTTTTGKTITRWSLCVNTGWGEQKHATWYECSLWGDRGPKVAGYLTKGKAILITGTPSMRTFEGRDGTPKTVIEVEVRDVTLLGDNKQQEQQQSAAAPSREPSQPDLDGEVPF